jgi:hypothetical protein
MDTITDTPAGGYPRLTLEEGVMFLDIGEDEDLVPLTAEDAARLKLQLARLPDCR